MAKENCPSLPIIDIDRYIHPTSLDERDAVIAEVREACQKFGFFQVKGHGVSQEAQKGLLQGLSNFFGLPREDKVKLSFLENPCRRGYEASGMTLREGDALPDSKEVSTMPAYPMWMLMRARLIPVFHLQGFLYWSRGAGR